MASYISHRGKRYKISRKFPTQKAADAYVESGRPGVSVLKQGGAAKRLSVITAKIDAGKDKGKYAVAWRAF